MREESTSVLIVGGGPVGLSTALFLARGSIPSIVVEQRATGSRIPRATNLHSRTMEIFRSIGLEPALRKVGLELVTPGTHVDEISAGGATPLIMYAANSLAELDPAAVLESYDLPYDDFTPCRPLWCGQDRFEPILLNEAVARGAEVRFDTEVVSLVQDDHGVEAIAEDRRSGERFTIRAAYAVAADGVRSPVRDSLGIGRQSRGVAAHFVSIIFRAEIGVLEQKPPFTFVLILNQQAPGLFIFVEPGRWMFQVAYLPDAGQTPAEFTEERCIELVRLATGVPDLEIEFETSTAWEAGHMIADHYRSGRVFLAGDACHAHPPAGGFGLNAGIQDAQNLAWKLSAVLDGSAGAALLDTYEVERRPIGAGTADQAWMLFQSRGGRLSDAEEDARRDVLVVATGYRYTSSATPGSDADAETFPKELTFPCSPGSRLPHGWLTENGDRVSSLDVVGHRIVLITGPDGADWVEVAHALDPSVRCRALGPSGDVIDSADWWSSTCGMPADGALLVRPDGFVAWRSTGAGPDKRAGLDDALGSILGLENSPL